MDDIQSDNEHSTIEPETLQKRDDAQFQADATRLIDDAEQMRIQFMKQRQSRGFIAMNAGILSLLIGTGGFGWFLLVKYNILLALVSIIVAAALPIALHIWASKPVQAYKDNYKAHFMPQIAKAMGNFKFFPARGISAKIIGKTAIVPSFDDYQAEDCFMGSYNGIKVILSEARLNKNKKNVFDGIFVMLELPEPFIKGHTILTANRNMVKAWARTRWQKLGRVDITTDNPEWNIFEAYSDRPDDAKQMITERLLKELSETSAIFDKSPISVVLFRKKYVFLMIPYEKNMFEASNMYVPVSTNAHAMACKKEIDQILEIIDVFEVYKNNMQAQAPAKDNTDTS